MQADSRRSHYCIKTISLVTVCIFTFTTIACSAPDAVYKIKVPEENGKVRQRYKGSSNKTVIHIQDAHASFDAQKNVSAIINDLIDKDETSLIGVEGASGYLPIDPYRSFPVKAARDAVAYDYMKQGKFSGSEHAAITGEKEFSLYGLEDEELFKSNFKTFYQTTMRREDILDHIAEIEAALENLKAPIYKPELKRFDKEATQYEQGRMELNVFLPLLFEQCALSGINTHDWPHIQEFKQVLALSQSYDPEKVNEEKDVLIEYFKAEEQSDLSLPSLLSDDNDISNRSLDQLLVNKAIEYKIDIAKYKNFKTSCEYQRLFSTLDFARLIEEVKALSLGVRLTLARTMQAKALVQQWMHIQLLKNICKLEAQRHEAEYFKAHANEFDFYYFYNFIRTACRAHRISYKISKKAVAINYAEAIVHKFYEEAFQRDQALVNNLLEQMRETQEETAVLLSGGFHSEGIAELLKEKGINYVTVTPNIDSLTADIPYAEKMTGKLFPIAPELVSMINALGTGNVGMQGEESLLHYFNKDALVSIFNLILGDELNNDALREALESFAKKDVKLVGSERFQVIVDEIKSIHLELVPVLLENNKGEDLTLAEIEGVVNALVRGTYEGDFAKYTEKLMSAFTQFFETVPVEVTETRSSRGVTTRKSSGLKGVLIPFFMLIANQLSAQPVDISNGSSLLGILSLIGNIVFASIMFYASRRIVAVTLSRASALKKESRQREIHGVVEKITSSLSGVFAGLLMLHFTGIVWWGIAISIISAVGAVYVSDKYFNIDANWFTRIIPALTFTAVMLVVVNTWGFVGVIVTTLIGAILGIFSYMFTAMHKEWQQKRDGAQVKTSVSSRRGFIKSAAFASCGIGIAGIGILLNNSKSAETVPGPEPDSVKTVEQIADNSFYTIDGKPVGKENLEAIMAKQKPETIKVLEIIIQAYINEAKSKGGTKDFCAMGKRFAMHSILGHTWSDRTGNRGDTWNERSKENNLYAEILFEVDDARSNERFSRKNWEALKDVPVGEPVEMFVDYAPTEHRYEDNGDERPYTHTGFIVKTSADDAVVVHEFGKKIMIEEFDKFIKKLEWDFPRVFKRTFRIEKLVRHNMYADTDYEVKTVTIKAGNTIEGLAREAGFDPKNTYHRDFFLTELIKLNDDKWIKIDQVRSADEPKLDYDKNLDRIVLKDKDYRAFLQVNRKIKIITAKKKQDARKPSAINASLGLVPLGEKITKKIDGDTVTGVYDIKEKFSNGAYSTERLIDINDKKYPFHFDNALLTIMNEKKINLGDKHSGFNYMLSSAISNDMYHDLLEKWLELNNSRIDIVLLDSGELSVEDHARDGFVGIPREIFDINLDPEILSIVLAIAVVDELRYEADIIQYRNSFKTSDWNNRLWKYLTDSILGDSFSGTDNYRDFLDEIREIYNDPQAKRKAAEDKYIQDIVIPSGQEGVDYFQIDEIKKRLTAAAIMQEFVDDANEILRKFNLKRNQVKKDPDFAEKGFEESGKRRIQRRLPVAAMKVFIDELSVLIKDYYNYDPDGFQKLRLSTSKDDSEGSLHETLQQFHLFREVLMSADASDEAVNASISSFKQWLRENRDDGQLERYVRELREFFNSELSSKREYLIMEKKIHGQAITAKDANGLKPGNSIRSERIDDILSTLKLESVLGNILGVDNTSLNKYRERVILKSMPSEETIDQYQLLFSAWPLYLQAEEGQGLYGEDVASFIVAIQKGAARQEHLKRLGIKDIYADEDRIISHLIQFENQQRNIFTQIMAEIIAESMPDDHVELAWQIYTGYARHPGLMVTADMKTIVFVDAMGEDNEIRSKYMQGIANAWVRDMLGVDNVVLEQSDINTIANLFLHIMNFPVNPDDSDYIEMMRLMKDPVGALLVMRETIEMNAQKLKNFIGKNNMHDVHLYKDALEIMYNKNSPVHKKIMTERHIYGIPVEQLTDDDQLSTLTPKQYAKLIKIAAEQANLKKDVLNSDLVRQIVETQDCLYITKDSVARLARIGGYDDESLKVLLHFLSQARYSSVRLNGIEMPVRIKVLFGDDALPVQPFMLAHSYIDVEQGYATIAIHDKTLKKAISYNKGLEKNGAYIIEKLLLPHEFRDIERGFKHDEDVGKIVKDEYGLPYPDAGDKDDFELLRLFWAELIYESGIVEIEVKDGGVRAKDAFGANETYFGGEKEFKSRINIAITDDENKQLTIFVPSNTAERKLYREAFRDLLLPFQGNGINLIEETDLEGYGSFEEFFKDENNKGKYNEDNSVLMRDVSDEADTSYKGAIRVLDIDLASSTHYIMFVSILVELMLKMREDKSIQGFDGLDIGKTFISINSEKFKSSIGNALEEEVRGRLRLLSA